MSTLIAPIPAGAVSRFEEHDPTGVRVIYVDHDSEVINLQKKIEELEQKLAGRDTFIRNIAQLFFAEDDTSRWHASQESGKSVDGEEAFRHWWAHGGSEEFAKRFPTAESVMAHFRRLHSKRKV